MPEIKIAKHAERDWVPCAKVSASGWQAWNDVMRPRPYEFHIVGDIHVPNPGVSAYLAYRTPQGINQAYLLLELHVVQEPGNWPVLPTTKQVRYERILPADLKYTNVDIYCGTDVVWRLAVQDIQDER